MKECDILILVLGCDMDPYNLIENEGIRKTWLKNKPDNVEVIFYYGNATEKTFTNDKLFLTIPEGIKNVGYKTIETFEYIKENYKFKYLYRTNISSYIDIPRLCEYLGSKPITKYYNGVIGNYNDIVFCSGSGYTITEDLLNLILLNKHIWNHDFIDDVSLGLLLKTLGISPTYGATRFDVIDILPIPNDYYHYRVKDPDNRNNDIIRLHKIHKIKGYEIN